MSTAAQVRAVTKFNKEKTIAIHVRLNKTTDADIIAYLEQQSSKMGYIKNLIRQDMKRP